MAGRGSTTAKVIGLVLLVVGIGLAYWGYEMSESISSRVTHTFTGSYSDEVVARFIGGAVGIVVGIYLLVKK